jgi:hypothetical protein
LNYQFFLNHYKKYLLNPVYAMQHIIEKSSLEIKKNPFLIIHCKCNVKIISESLMDISDVYFHELGVGVCHETKGEDIMIYFHKKEDFDIMMTPRHEPLKEKQFLETYVGPINPEFFVKRNQIIGKIVDLFTK